ncbi:hypothetical protein HYV80_00960 [Candidatus Woesearchaeota archaeon]|nr:hypothetical protein [Candidatus Woesearchaeota archaeon]
MENQDLYQRLRIYALSLEEQLAFVNDAIGHYTRIKYLDDKRKELKTLVAKMELSPEERKNLEDSNFRLFNVLAHILATASPNCPAYQHENGPRIAIRDFTKIAETLEKTIKNLYELVPEIKPEQNKI